MLVVAGMAGVPAALPFFFASLFTVTPTSQISVDMLPQALSAGILSLAVALPLALPFSVTGRDLGVLAVMGCIQLGAGCLLATAASRHLTATELGLLGLLEPILGPIWVWTLMGEHPGGATLVGGAIDLAAVIVNEIVAAMRARGGTASSGVPPIA